MPTVLRSLAVVLAALVPLPAAAQLVRGTVVVEPGPAPVEGALVSLLDTTTAPRATAITGADGGFRLRAPAAGRYRVVARRIGFAPDTSPPVTVPAGGEAAVRLAVTRTPFTLAATRVVADVRCGGEQASPRTLALLDQARLALELERATRAEGRFGAEIEVTGQVLDGNGADVRRAERTRRAGPTTAPFVTVAPESIAVRGYVARDSTGYVFHAPDADVLLAPDFLRTHCVLDARGEGGLDAVGIRTASSVPGTGVRGTLLLDPRTAELRRFEFRYERLPSELRGREAGGWVAYRPVQGGRWIADAWTIRFPLVAGGPTAIVGRGVTVERVQQGRVLRVYAAGAADSVRSRGALVTGVVLDSLGGGAPLAGAEVRVRGTARVAVTDSAGRFRFDSVPAGRRGVTLAMPGLDSLGIGVAPRWVDVQDGDSLHVVLATPSPVALRAAACGGDSARAATAPGILLLGTVRDARTGAPRADATVRAEWITLDRAGRLADARTEWREVRTDEQGAYALCDVPLRDAARVALSARAGGAGTGAVWLPPEVRPPYVVGLTVADDAGRESRRVGSAALAGRVVGVDGAPLVGARVRVDGVDSVARTTATGDFRLAGLPGGTHTLRVAHLGASPTWRLVDLVPGEERRVEVRLSRGARTLPTVVVRGERDERGLALDAVERRLRPRADVWMDRAVYLRRRTNELLDPLKPYAQNHGQLANGFQFPVLARGAVGWCVPLVVADDRPLELLEIPAVNPADVEALAVFRQGTNAPGGYASMPTLRYDDLGRRDEREGKSDMLTEIGRRDLDAMGIREGIRYGPQCGVVMVYTQRGRGSPPPR